MSILQAKINEAGLAAKARSEKVNKGIAHAATVLHESALGRRCPNLVKGIESDSREAKYAAATLVQLLENTAAYVAAQPEYAGRNLLMEDVSTTATTLLNPGVATLTPATVDIVNVFYPQMVANYIADIQALDRQSGQIFTIKTRYSETAAGVNEGEIVFEKPTDGTYATEGMVSYANKAVAASMTDTPATTLDKALKAGSFIVRYMGKEVARDYGNGNSAGDYVVIGKGISGTVKAADGEYTLTVDTNLYSGEFSFEATKDAEEDKDLIRKIQFDVPNTPVMAKEHPLMSTYSVAAGLVMNAHLAIDTDELIANQIAGTIRWERDLALVKMVSGAATATPALDFDCAANGANVTLTERYKSYKAIVSAARGLIQDRAGRGTVEFIICSAKEGLPVIENIEGFKAAPEAKKPIGPYLAGTLNDGTVNVIAVPYSKTLRADEVIFGFKGFQVGDSAVVLAEWVPLYFTPTFQAPSLRNHKGALSFYDLVLNKPEYLVKGAIKNFNVA